MILRVTGKVSKKIKVKPGEALSRHSNPFLDWTMHAFIANRLQYIMATNSESLLSCVYFGKGIANQSAFIMKSFESITECLLSYGFDFIAQNIIGSQIDNVRLSKVGDRKINGCMNDLIYHAQGHIIEGGLTPFETTRRINEIPQCTMEYAFPIDAFGRLQANEGN